MKRFYRNIAIFLLPVLAGVVLLFLLPLSKDFSYHFVKGECDNKASWIYNRIFGQAENIDVAFMGASHISCAIMDEYIEYELSVISEQEIKVANLGYCRGGRDIQYLMLKDLFQNKKPKILVLEVMEDEPKKSHPVFPYLAESVDLWGSFIFFNQRYFSNIWKGIVVRFEQLKFHFFPYSNLIVQNNNSFGYLPSEQIVQPEDIVQNERNWKNRLSKTKPKFLRNIETSYSKHYIEKMVKLATENNCKVLFLYLPESGSKLEIPLYWNFYENFGEVIVLPDSIISNPSYWKDATHFNDLGASEVSEFLVQELVWVLY